MNVLYDALLAPHRGSDRIFARTPDGTTWTYGALHDRVAQAAHVLRDRGLAPGDRVAVQCDKCLDMLALYGACMATGAIFLPLNTAYTATEMAYFLGDATPRLLVCAPDRRDTLEPIAANHGGAALTLGPGGGTFGAAMDDSPTDLTQAARETDDLACFLYTSGTTGRSKGAMITHGNLLSNAQALVDAWQITGDDRLLHVLPIFHAHGLFVAINTTWATGASLVFLPAFSADAVLDALPAATTMMGVPTHYTRLLAEPRFNREACAHMRLFVSGSAPLAAEAHRRFEERTGHRILERYGMTETGMNASNPHDGARRPGTVGHALPGVEIEVRDDGGAALGPGEVGMIHVRGPNVFRGYWQMPDKTADELGADGWFVTGDMGRWDADGYLTIVGRGKDLIISGGYNVYPKEVEDVLDGLPGVAESAVIGVPHPDFGEAVVAVLVGDGPIDTAQLGEASAGQLANYKRPKHFALVDSLPRNTMGKVQKAALRKTYGDIFT